MSTEFFIPDGLVELRDDLPLVVRMIARSLMTVKLFELGENQNCDYLSQR
jgi:hypothetical protein